MKKKMNGDYFKLYADIRRDSANRIAYDLREKERRMNYVRQDKRDLDICNQGLEWYKNGFALEDAPLELRNNTNFINGFNKGKRLDMIESLQNESKKSR